MVNSFSSLEISSEPEQDQFLLLKKKKNKYIITNINYNNFIYIYPIYISNNIDSTYIISNYLHIQNLILK